MPVQTSEKSTLWLCGMLAVMLGSAQTNRTKYVVGGDAIDGSVGTVFKGDIEDLFQRIPDVHPVFRRSMAPGRPPVRSVCAWSYTDIAKLFPFERGQLTEGAPVDLSVVEIDDQHKKTHCGGTNRRAKRGAKAAND